MTYQLLTGTSRRALVGCLSGALALSLTVPALADDPNDQKRKVDSQIGQTRKDLDGISAELATAQRTLTTTTKRVGIARSNLTKAETELRRANGYNRDIGARLKVAQANELKTRRAQTTNTQAQQRTKQRVGGIARRSYMQGGTGRLELTLSILRADGPSVTDDLALADVVVRQQGGVLRSLKGQQSTGKTQANRLTGIRAQVSSLKIKAQAGVGRAAKARDGARRAKSSLDGLLKAQTTAANVLKGRKAKELADLQRLQRESQRLGGVLKARASARAKARAAAAKVKRAPAVPDRVQPKPAAGGYFLTGPAPKAQITSPFGYRLHPILRIPRLHGGADFSFGCGQPVYAAADGQIVTAGTNSVAGNHVIIDHGDVGSTSLATQYDHLSAIVVRSGRVQKGQLIGRVGSTGRSTGCHLHFVVLANGAYVNPASWIG